MPPLPSKVIPRPLGKPPPPKWLEMTIALPVTKPDGKPSTRDTEVQRLGALVVHRGFSSDTGPDLWVITSLTVGERICFVKELADAQRIAETLWLHAREALSLSVPSEMCRRFPAFVVPWCRRCREEGKWVDPKEYMK